PSPIYFIRQLRCSVYKSGIMELRHLRYFVAVAEELHFSRAARQLNISQPPLSQQIRQLERELDVSLFHRTKRHVTLTDAGRVLLAEATRVLAQTDHVAHAVQRASRGEVGHLSIGFTPSTDLEVLPRVLRPWVQRYPNVKLDLHTLYTGPQVEAL